PGNRPAGRSQTDPVYRYARPCAHPAHVWRAAGRDCWTNLLVCPATGHHRASARVGKPSFIVPCKNDSPLGLLVGVLGLRGLEGFGLGAIGPVDKLRQFDATNHLFVVDEAQGGYGMNVQKLEQQGVQPAGLLGQRRGRCFGLGAHDGEIHLGMGVIGRQVDAGKRDQASAGYIHLALYQAGQILLDLVGQPGIATRISLGFMTAHDYSVRAISLISKISSWSPTSMSLLPFKVIPQSKPDLTSLTSSLKRRSESIQPLQ